MKQRRAVFLGVLITVLWSTVFFDVRAQTVETQDGPTNKTQTATRAAAESDTETAPEEEGLKNEIDQLHTTVKAKQGSVRRLEGVIGNYRAKMAEQEQAIVSLANEVALLELSAKEKQLRMEQTKQQIEIIQLEIQAMTRQIIVNESVIRRRQEGLEDLVRRVHDADQVSVVDAFLTRPSLSELFVQMEEIKRVEEDLTDATKRVQNGKKMLEQSKSEQESRRLALQDEKQRLQEEQRQLEANRSAKMTLVAETQNREQEFQRIIFELRQQQQTESDEISSLEDRLQDRLNAADEALARGDILFYWPLSVKKGISARFHDPTYPFRQMFEHPGIDIPTDVGTPVHAAAGGYVAWTRTGKQYGNYVMIVHAGGIATVYGHLSRFAVKPDTYVERGDIIGYSGGRPGSQGAGLSTGPHLHFEVRQSGIPVNPENFLPNL